MQHPSRPAAGSPGQQEGSALSIAIAALQFLAGEPERIAAFLAESGLDPHELRGHAQDPFFLSGILDHLLANETLLLAFCAESGIDPERVLPARDSMAAAGGMAPIHEG